MKFLVISDLHGNKEILDKMQTQFNEADAVLFAGDFTKFNEIETGLPALEKLCAMHDTIYSVLGNCDPCDFIENLENKDINVQGCLITQSGLAFAGSGGGSKFSGDTPNEREDNELAEDFNIVTDTFDGEWNNLIAIMHNPPKDTKCDMIPNGIHVGSPALRSFIEKVQPLAVVTGHIHESAGIDTIGKTTVINPGPLLEGCYATLEVQKNGEEWSVVKAELKKL